MATKTAVRCLVLSSMLFLLGGCLDFPKEAEVNPARGEKPLRISLGEAEKNALVEYLKSL